MVFAVAFQPKITSKIILENEIENDEKLRLINDFAQRLTISEIVLEFSWQMTNPEIKANIYARSQAQYYIFI